MKVKFWLIVLLTFMFSSGLQLNGQQIETGEYLYEKYEQDGSELLYRIMYPIDFTADKEYPLLVFLHGMGERGNDNELQLMHGSKLFRDSLEKYPAIVLFPQCPENDYWADISRPDQGGLSRNFIFHDHDTPNKSLGLLMGLIDEMLQKVFIDQNRLYVAGLSMGGMGTFELSWRLSDKIAASMPICGGASPVKADKLKEVPMWIFHGLKDDIVNPNLSVDMLKSIQMAGGKAKISLYENANHNSWDNAFAEPDFLKWMFKQQRDPDHKVSINWPVLSYNVEKIFAQMTLEEKIGQLNLLTPGGTVTGQVVSKDVGAKIKAGKVGGIFGIRGAAKVRQAQKIAVEESRLGIPLMVGLDVIHGHQTIFPIPLGLSCTWDMDLIQKTARQAAREATADGLMWTFSPMVDIARDPRWGRIAEGAGEDPYLGGQIAKAMVRGYQGDQLNDPTTMLACVKHFANYGAAEGGRDYATADMSSIKSHNEYLPPYKAAVDAGVASVMTSFNVYEYDPASGNKKLFKDILRDRWGFEGFVVTDYTAVNEMIDHGVGDLATVSAKSLNAGIDMDMVGEGFVNTLKASVENDLVLEESINVACRRILQAKEKLGLFDDPYRYFDEERAKKEILSPGNRAFARKVAGESFVLLKNDSQLLPLKKQGKIALIGPLADSRRNMLGTWSVSGDHNLAVTLKEGIEAAVGKKADILYALGANISDDPVFADRVNAFGPEIVIDPRDPDVLIAEALEIANRSDVVVAVVGEAADMSGEASSMAHIGLQPSQQKLLKALKETGKPIVLVLYNGRPMTLVWEDQNMDAILDVWFGGTEGANAVADVLFGDVNPGGRLTTSFPVHVGQIPVYHGMLNTGRPDTRLSTKFWSSYLDIPNEPLYPFGYGLSYTEFSYGDIEMDRDTMEAYTNIVASVLVTNTGKRNGSEVVQMYIQDKVGSISRPKMELKGFQKIVLKPGESQKVYFTIDASDLKFYDANLKFLAEPGQFELMIGRNAADVKKKPFVLK